MATLNVLESVNNLKKYKCVRVPVGSVGTVVRAAERAGLCPNGGAISEDCKFQWLYLN